MFIIQLNNLQFFSFHGVHEEEKILGNNYDVNVSVSFEQEEDIKHLEQTINYVSVYQLVKKRMDIPEVLLETLVQDLARMIYDLDNRIKTITVAVEKKNPPMINIQGSVSVIYTKEF